MTEQAKRCAICNGEIKPDKRVATRQYVCRSAACQRERKRRNQASWTKRNPGYFKGRYSNTKRWLAKHPGYLNDWRRQQQERLNDIQVELSSEKTISVPELRDIQDELTVCITNQLKEIDSCIPYDIQDELTLSISVILLVLIYKSRLRL